MEIRKVVYSVALLALTNGKLMTHSHPLVCANHRIPTEQEKAAAEVHIRGKYIASALKFYGITYQQLNDIIKKHSEELLRQQANKPTCHCFEDGLEETVVTTLQERAKEHHAIKKVSSAEVHKRVEQHELKLKQQYGKPDQLNYFKISYSQLVDTLKVVSKSMFDGNEMNTTEAHLAETFRVHTDRVLEKLNAHRNR